MKTRTLSDTSIDDDGNLVVQETVDPTLDIVRRHLPANYSNLQAFREGGTRKVFLADWGPKGKQRVIKVDKNPSTPHAERNVSRGYNTGREVVVASGIDEPEEHHLIRLYDYLHVPELEKLGFSGVASIEDYFPGETLEDRVKEKGPFTGMQAGQLFSGVLDALRYLQNDQGLFHRDLNRKNILIKENGKVEARVNDLTNACSISEVIEKSRPTSGSRFVLDPTTEEIFTGHTSAYNAGSEMYMVGKNMLYALTGEEAVKYNPDSGEAINVFTGESLLTNGKLDAKKHKAAIDKAVEKIPKDGRRYVPFIRKTLTLDEAERYTSIDECVSDFDKASKPTLWEKIKRNGRIATGIATGVLALGGILGNHMINQEYKNKQLQVELEKSLKYPVIGEWDGSTLEVSNGLTSLGVRVHRNQEWDKTYPKNVDYLQITPGDKLWVDILADAIPRPKDSTYHGNPGLSGKIYLEGFGGENFGIYPGPTDKTEMYGDIHGIGIGYMWRSYEIPKDVPNGNHNLIVELYAGNNKRENEHIISSSEESINFLEPGRVIARKRIPVVVGDVKHKIDAKSLNSKSYFSNAFFSVGLVDSTFGRIDPGLKYEISVPELGIFENYGNEMFNSNTFSQNIDLPKEDSTGLVRTLQIVARDPVTGKVISADYLPISNEKKHGYGYYNRWGLANPDTSWSSNLIAYRKALQGDSTGLYDIQAEVRRYQGVERARADSIRVSDSLLQEGLKTAMAAGRGAGILITKDK